MQRRDFVKNTALCAIAVSASGFVRFNGKRFVGDCETTTDILGPFYRPNSPVRNNLSIKGETGDKIELSGYIRHKDCTTPYKNAKVEIWHCDTKGIYDNESNEFRYRGTSFSNDKGFYSFQTILPVPYEAGGGLTRPAHFHVMITAAGYQPLVTQLYFSGDEHIKKDPYASSPQAKKRILAVQKMKTGITKVSYDVGMSDTLKVEPATIDKFIGVYKEVAENKKLVELFKHENTLWMKNEAFGNRFEYTGNNTFEEANNPQNFYWKLQFEFPAPGVTQITESYIDNDLSKKVFVYLKQV